jgi:hypothetical protein
MRNSFLFVFSLVILSITGCEKETPLIVANNSYPPLTLPVPGPFPNDSTPPTAFAGSDLLVFLPADSCKLFGWSMYHMNNIKSYKWRKISGPSAFKFSSPDSFRTSVNDLIGGIYEFELTVVDNVGLTDADTATITVKEMPLPQFLFQNISWYFDELGERFELPIKNIFSYIPVTNVFNVYISNRLGSWVHAFESGSSGSEDAQYVFQIYNHHLSVWSYDDQEGTAEIMIAY